MTVPKRKPAYLKELEGSREPDRNYARPAPHLPPEPNWFSILGDRKAAADARAWWAEAVPILDETGLLTRLDATVVVEAAICHARVRQCERELAGNMLVDGPRGCKVRNPISMTLASYRQSLKTYVQQLGLSPAARQVIDIPNPISQGGGLNPLEEIIWGNAATQLVRDHGMAWRAHMPSQTAEIYAKDPVYCDAVIRDNFAWGIGPKGSKYEG